MALTMVRPKTKRVRDYKAEYTRRIAKGRAAGLSQSQARGHREQEIHRRSESQYRTHRARIKFGASPAVLTRLRKAATDHVLAQLGMVKTVHRVMYDTVVKGMRLLSARMLEETMFMSGEDLKLNASLAYLVLAEEIDEDPANWHSRNPYWYA